MNRKQLESIGVPQHLMKEAVLCVTALARSGMRGKTEIGAEIRKALAGEGCDPRTQVLRDACMTIKDDAPLEKPVSFKCWGVPDSGTLAQMRDACRLPVSVKGALLPDSHIGFGVPIGGVLATRNAVVPYAVGVDIACRMRFTITDDPFTPSDLNPDRTEKWRSLVAQEVEKHTRFGAGISFDNPKDHPVLYDEAWKDTKMLSRIRDLKAVQQLGSSGTGNHFVSVGVVTAMDDIPGYSLKKGESKTAVMTHSGSRGPGAMVADYYCNEASRLRRHLPDNLRRLAWLDLDSDIGREYWLAMELMGRYAAACHEVIHRDLIKGMDCVPEFSVENHHNFAWKEMVDGEELIVHRKGATPAGVGVMGIIPGTMADSAYLVVGLGNEASMNSASHGAGRAMSRSQAKSKITRAALYQRMRNDGITLIGGDVDEHPDAYKKIDEVMAFQEDLVKPVAIFRPLVVRMAGSEKRMRRRDRSDGE